MVQMAQLLPSPFTRVQVSGRHMPAWWDLAAPQGGGALLPLPLLAALLGLDLSQPWCSCPKAVLTAAPSCFHKAPLAAAATAVWAISPVSSISKAGSSCIRPTCNASSCCCLLQVLQQAPGTLLTSLHTLQPRPGRCLDAPW